MEHKENGQCDMHNAFLKEARAAYLQGKNVTEFLRNQYGVDDNTPRIIEISYELQAGSYSRGALEDSERLDAYCGEMASILSDHVKPGYRMLDVGTGELTTLAYLSHKLTVQEIDLLAFDISWSRLIHGLRFCQDHMKPELRNRLTVFCADMREIPLLSKSVDMVVSSHALEPNGGKEKALLSEIFRVARRKVVLFEPAYEINSDEGRRRMERLGYVRDLPGAITALGAQFNAVIPIVNVANPLNPTAAYVIDPPVIGNTPSNEVITPEIFADPGTNDPLRRDPDSYFSTRQGVSYPIIQGIPVLRSDKAVLTTAKLDDDAG
jgi:uncharacterized protein YbaR (Trm112 family)